MAAAMVLSQIQVILVRMAKGHVLRPGTDGWLSLRQGNFNVDVDVAN